MPLSDTIIPGLPRRAIRSLSSPHPFTRDNAKWPCCMDTRRRPTLQEVWPRLFHTSQEVALPLVLFHKGSSSKAWPLPKRNLVTACELSKMRKIVPNETPDEIRIAFPHRTLTQTRKICRYRGIYRLKAPLKATGYPILDAIRLRCFEFNYSMRDLDALEQILFNPGHILRP